MSKAIKAVAVKHLESQIWSVINWHHWLLLLSISRIVSSEPVILLVSLYVCSSFASSLALLHVASQQTASTRDQQTSTHIKEGIAFWLPYWNDYDGCCGFHHLHRASQTPLRFKEASFPLSLWSTKTRKKIFLVGGKLAKNAKCHLNDFDDWIWE